ncbi:D-lactate dehydrogenase [cytochrome], mitochondrial [Colletotrichum tanaceti]|uniref:D-lactate dehydrogenase (cytochrome) n=1 Tax=Colletotrichum tanaceti TaxID=1306861 RepID=A0A4U6XAM9_9PEZI|nr:D-lactate dehydrogenase [cytochrome], mitochondrial [Colletotrichum tanaceti]KAJ0165050.1 D-lactate dehydrogenase [cytochrome], mitochondrial [Colletotrichum tanaceti]TKW52731.1 D-lactate dehydrogenase [cytochrome], mitochondrial [Colletotrichum tanaceti]
MAFRASSRSASLLRSAPHPCRNLTRRPVLPQVPACRFAHPRFLQSTSSQPSRKSHRFIPLQLLALGAIPLLAGYLLGRSGASAASDTTPQGKLSHVDFADREHMLLAAKEISDALGDDALSFDEDEIELHGHSDWSTSNSSGRPVAIVYPRTTEEVSRIARICHKHNVPMVPYGAGSSVEGSFSSPYSGICIDFVHMDKIIAFHPDDMDVVVQPGVNWVTLNKTIQDAGLFLPLDPSPTATIGGMVSTNCSGTNAFRYGTMKDWVVSLTVVLADGRVVKTRRRPRKSSAGYNLTSLFVGAEGTLGLVAEATLRLAVVPRDTGVAAVSFPGVDEAARAAAGLIRSGVQLGALELMDEVQMQVINRHGSAAVRKTAWDEKPTLFLKFSGTTDGIKTDISRVKDIVQPFNPRTIFFARDKQEEADLWAARKEALWTMTSIKPEGYSLWSTDVAVPISRLAEIISESVPLIPLTLSPPFSRWLLDRSVANGIVHQALSKEDSGKLGLFASVIGHVGDGNFHQAVMYDPRNEGQQAAVAKCVHDMMSRALEMEGTVSGEHAIGIGKKDCLVDELGSDAIDLMRTLKQAVDPKWIMNPGKVFDLPAGSKAVAAS